MTDDTRSSKHATEKPANNSGPGYLYTWHCTHCGNRTVTSGKTPHNGCQGCGDQGKWVRYV